MLSDGSAANATAAGDLMAACALQPPVLPPAASTCKGRGLTEQNKSRILPVGPICEIKVLGMDIIQLRVKYRK